jgi:hypothetical protein
MGYTELLQVNHCRICFAIVIVNFKAKSRQHHRHHNHHHLSQLWISQAKGWQGPKMHLSRVLHVRLLARVNLLRAPTALILAIRQRIRSFADGKHHTARRIKEESLDRNEGC